MDRDGLVEPLVGVAEVDGDDVAHLALERRARHAGGPDRLAEAGRVALVDERAERPRAPHPFAHPLVLPGRGDVPPDRPGGEPVLAPDAAGLRLRRVVRAGARLLRAGRLLEPRGER